MPGLRPMLVAGYIELRLSRQQDAARTHPSGFMTARRIWIVAALGWALFALTLWYDHHPQPPDEVPPKTAEALAAAGFTEAKVSAIAPLAVLERTVKIPGAERIVYVKVSVPPTEPEPSVVRASPANCIEGATQVTNWTLRPGDLGIRDAAIDIRKAGRHAFVAARGTITAQTPDGEVVRTGDAPSEDAWVSTKALGIPPRLGPMFRVTTLQTAEAGLYWTKGRAQYDATAGYDFDRREWFGGAGIRF